MQKKAKKLTLAKETVRALEYLGAVAGGYTLNSTCVGVTCPCPGSGTCGCETSNGPYDCIQP